jgi:hypothetical protein
MSDFKPAKPASSPALQPQKAASGPNAERRAKALRDNLMKRKTQARARADSDEVPESESQK